MVDRGVDIGARIAAAREASRLTQAELARASGVERSALAKIERGLRGVGALELADLAEALGVRIDWFVLDSPPAITSHRVRVGTEAELSSIDKTLERIARDVELVTGLGALAPAQLDPEPVPTTATEAERLAAGARKRCGLAPNDPVRDVAAVVSGIGLYAFARPLGSETADAASTLLTRGGVALINSTGWVGRRRLALAHELGHYLVADEYTIDWRVAETGDPGRTENLLDRFARAFLAPEGALSRYWNGLGDADLRTRAVLATSHFQIDMSTLARRLTDLKLADAAQCDTIRSVRTTKTDIIEHGLSIPYDLDAVGLPRVYEKAVLDLYRKQRISAERAVALLHGTFTADDLPAVADAHPDEIWSLLR